MPAVKEGNQTAIDYVQAEYNTALLWSATRANAESKRARQEIFERLCACPAHPATLAALESIKARLFSGHVSKGGFSPWETPKRAVVPGTFAYRKVQD